MSMYQRFQPLNHANTRVARFSGCFYENARSVVYHRRVVLLSEATMENLVTPKYFNLDWILECQPRCQNHVTLEILHRTGPSLTLDSLAIGEQHQMELQSLRKPSSQSSQTSSAKIYAIRQYIL
jgi:hypothetical protein